MYLAGAIYLTGAGAKSGGARAGAKAKAGGARAGAKAKAGGAKSGGARAGANYTPTIY